MQGRNATVPEMRVEPEGGEEEEEGEEVKHLGDITQVDWFTVEPVDVVTGGSPCQDLSVAGKRKKGKEKKVVGL